MANSALPSASIRILPSALESLAQLVSTKMSLTEVQATTSNFLRLQLVVVLHEAGHVLLVAGRRIGAGHREQRDLLAAEHLGRLGRLGGAVRPHGHECCIGQAVADLDRHNADPFRLGFADWLLKFMVVRVAATRAANLGACRRRSQAIVARSEVGYGTVQVASVAPASLTSVRVRVLPLSSRALPPRERSTSKRSRPVGAVGQALRQRHVESRPAPR